MTLFKRIFSAMVAIAMAVAATGTATAQARDRQLSEEQRAQIEQQLTEIRTRLNLTAEQEARLQPILRSSFEKRLAVLDAHGLSREGGQRPTRQQMRALRGEMTEIREATEAQVATVLDAGQMAEFRKIQDEMREQMRARIRDRRQ